VRPLRCPSLVLVIAALAVGLPTAAGALPSASSSPASVAANSTTYQDSVGEDPAAPDITTITVSNDDAAMLTFRVEIPNRPQLGRDMAAFFFVDSDANPATGDPQALGADYVIQLLLGEIILFRWDGTDYSLSPLQSSLSYSWSNGLTMRISAADLGNTRKFNFDVTVLSGLVVDETTGAIDCPAATCKRDFAPTFGFYQYVLQITPPSLVVRRLTTTPRVPRAGREFTMRLTAARSDTGATVQNGRVTCVARVGGVRLRAQQAQVTGGAAVCTWMIPPKAKGKLFRGSLTIAFEGLKATRSISRRVA
jgi:hypothetical protein